jgi:hypothetical protein
VPGWQQKQCYLLALRVEINMYTFDRLKPNIINTHTPKPQSHTRHEFKPQLGLQPHQTTTQAAAVAHAAHCCIAGMHKRQCRVPAAVQQLLIASTYVSPL